MTVKTRGANSPNSRIKFRGTTGRVYFRSAVGGGGGELVYDGTFGSQVITGGESVLFSFLPIGPTPNLTTTLVDTSWTLKDQFDAVIATGTLPINNLRTLWVTYFLSGGTAYTMIASGITFTITRIGG